MDTQRRIGQASKGAVEDLYRRHFVDAARLAYLLTGDRAVAEDLAQEAFLSSAARIWALRSPAGFPAYLRRSVVRAVLQHQRAEGRRAGRAQRAIGRERPGRDPLESSIERVDLDRLLAALPPRQRAALVLRYWHDLSETEIAAAPRCPTGTVKSAISRGLVSLRKELSANV